MPYFRASDAVADVEANVLVTLDMYDACLYSEGLAQVAVGEANVDPFLSFLFQAPLEVFGSEMNVPALALAL